MIKAMVPQDFQDAADELKVDLAALKAVAKVESSGGGFFSDGRPKILFEAHIFSRRTNGVYDSSHPLISSKKWNRKLYVGGVKEHDRLAQAAELDRTAALESTSWGMFQIMGFNYSRCGFSDVQSFVNAMYESEGAQLKAFCQFVKASHLDDELQRHDWAGFANGYNGPGFAANRYDTKLQAAYERFTKEAA